MYDVNWKPSDREGEHYDDQHDYNTLFALDLKHNLFLIQLRKTLLTVLFDDLQYFII